MAAQPFYHQAELLFTATCDVSDDINSREFLDKLDKLLKKEFGRAYVKGSVEFHKNCLADPGDPADL